MRKTLGWLLVLSIVLSLPLAVSAEDPYKEHYSFSLATYLTAPADADAIIIKKVEEMFNVDVEVLNIDDATFMEVINTRIAGGEMPDVIRLKDPAQLLNYVDQGVIGEIPMNIVREHLPSVSNALDGFVEGSFWGMGAVDGVQYAIPAISNGNIFHLPIIFNKNWMDAVGIPETPTTLEELETLFYAFANNDPDGNGQKDTYGVASDGLRLLFGAFGVNPGAADGRADHSYFQLIDDKVEWAAGTEQYREALRVARKWYDDGIIDPEFITGENTGGYWAISHSFINGRIGMTVRGNYYHWVMPGMYKDWNADGELVDITIDTAGNVAKELLAVDPNAHIVYGDPVEGPYGPAGVKNWNLLAQFWVFSPEITSDSGKFTRVMDIMEYMGRQYIPEATAEKQEYLELLYGPEGENWYWKDKPTGQWNRTQTHWDEYPEFAAVDLLGPNQWGPTFPGPQVDARSKFGYSLGYDEGGINNLVQFSLPTMAEYQNNITMMKDNAMIEFITGKRDLDKDWDAYINEMNAAGLAEMLGEVREWYDANYR